MYIYSKQSLPEFEAQQSQQARGAGSTNSQHHHHLSTPPQSSPQSQHHSAVFTKYDVVETSYHFFSERIDLHFCDDPGSKFIFFI